MSGELAAKNKLSESFRYKPDLNIPMIIGLRAVELAGRANFIWNAWISRHFVRVYLGPLRFRSS